MYAADTGGTSYMRFETNYNQKGLDGSYGAISSAIQKNFTVLNGLTLTGHDLTYTAGQGSIFLDPSFTVDYSGTTVKSISNPILTARRIPCPLQTEMELPEVIMQLMVF